jgi:hypothetical protein
MAARSLIPIAILFAIGPIFLAATAVSFISTARFLAGTTTAQASFAGSKVRRGGSHGGAIYYRQFSFRTRDGRQVAFVAGIGFTDQPYVDRQRVTIVYDPANPEHAELASFWSLWAVTLFLAPFALPFAGIPAAVFVLMRGRRDLQPQQDFV